MNHFHSTQIRYEFEVSREGYSSNVFPAEGPATGQTIRCAMDSVTEDPAAMTPGSEPAATDRIWGALVDGACPVERGYGLTLLQVRVRGSWQDVPERNRFLVGRVWSPPGSKTFSAEVTQVS